MRVRVTLAVVATVLTSCFAWAAVSVGAASFASSSAVSASYLFSIPAGGGSLIGPNDKHLTLRLIGARDYLTQFTDVPLHSAQILAAASFAAQFAQAFGGASPNAVLTYTPFGQSIPISIIVEVSHPKWSAATHSWTFAAVRIRKTTTTPTLRPPSIPNPKSFHDGTLVVDGTIAHEFGHNLGMCHDPPAPSPCHTIYGP